jgi:hypothetical protein
MTVFSFFWVVSTITANWVVKRALHGKYDPKLERYIFCSWGRYDDHNGVLPGLGTSFCKAKLNHTSVHYLTHPTIETEIIFLYGFILS